MTVRRWQCLLLEVSRRRPKRICRAGLTEDGDGGDGGDAEKKSLNIFRIVAKITIWRSSAGVAACPMVECAVLESGERLKVHRRACNPTLEYRQK